MSNRPVVFGIGFPRTGTVSLGKALERIGWTVVHDFYRCRWLAEELLEGRMPVQLERAMATGGVAFLDGIWWKCAALVRSCFPEAVLVHTWRPVSEWRVSMMVLYGALLAAHRPVDEWATLGQMTRDFEFFNAMNQRLFAGDERYVFLDLRSDKWGPLCSALQIAAPDEQWPHAHSKEFLLDRIRAYQGA